MNSVRYSSNQACSAHVVLLDHHDPRYSFHAIQGAQRAKDTDELTNRPVVYIEVREMATVHSRLLKINVLTSPPAYTAAV